jgi:hypothetical protein
MEINGTWERVDNLDPSPKPTLPIQMLYDEQTRNDRRPEEYSTKRRLKLTDGRETHFIVKIFIKIKF